MRIDLSPIESKALRWAEERFEAAQKELAAVTVELIHAHEQECDGQVRALKDGYGFTVALEWDEKKQPEQKPRLVVPDAECVHA